MLMHTRGILVMTPESAMVLTGKQALDYSGGVSAEDNFGIGGYERIMGPTGRRSTGPRTSRTPAGCCWRTTSTPTSRRASASRVGLDHGPDRPRRARGPALGPRLRLRRVGEIFSDETNPGRKKPFDIRSVMRATIDPTGPWSAGRDARRRDRGRVGGSPRRLARDAARVRITALGALRAGACRRPRPMDRGHPVSALVEEDRPRDQRRRRAAAGGRARQPFGLRRLAGVDV